MKLILFKRCKFAGFWNSVILLLNGLGTQHFPRAYIPIFLWTPTFQKEKQKEQISGFFFTQIPLMFDLPCFCSYWHKTSRTTLSFSLQEGLIQLFLGRKWTFTKLVWIEIPKKSLMHFLCAELKRKPSSKVKSYFYSNYC